MVLNKSFTEVMQSLYHIFDLKGELIKISLYGSQILECVQLISCIFIYTSPSYLEEKIMTLRLYFHYVLYPFG